MDKDTNEYYERRIRRYQQLRKLYVRKEMQDDERDLLGILVSESEYKTLLMALKTWLINFRYRYEDGDKIYYEYFGNR